MPGGYWYTTYMKKAKRLIVFFVPEDKLVNGGILSIFSIARVSREFQNIHKAEVVISVPPGCKSYRHNDLFQNNETVYSFDEIVANGPYDSVLLHIPEFASYNTYMSLKKYGDFITAIPDLHVNILHQNFLLMQPPEEVALWFSLTPHVTQTTAHNRYSTQELADTYAMPVHHLSTFVDQNQYHVVPIADKEKIIAISPDQSPLRDAIEQRLRAGLPDYQVITIENMKYEDYKEFIAKTKYVLTLGEGFDGYYVEAFFTGGLAFAVYNSNFFPDEAFATFDNTYLDEQTLANSIVKDIQQLDVDHRRYQKINSANLKKINALYSYKNYRNNIKLFYEQAYKLVPVSGSRTKLLGTYVTAVEKARDHDRAEIRRLETAVHDMEEMIADKSKHIRELDAKIDEMENSKSWRVTKPLRSVSSKLGKSN